MIENLLQTSILFTLIFTLLSWVYDGNDAPDNVRVILGSGFVLGILASFVFLLIYIWMD